MYESGESNPVAESSQRRRYDTWTFSGIEMAEYKIVAAGDVHCHFNSPCQVLDLLLGIPREEVDAL